MTEPGVKTSSNPTDCGRMNTRNMKVCSHRSVDPSGWLHLLISGVNKNRYKRNMCRVRVKQLEPSDPSALGTVCKWRPLPAAATPQRTADKAAPGSCSSLHTGSPPGQSARPPSGQGSTNVQRGHGGPHKTFCATRLHLKRF